MNMFCPTASNITLTSFYHIYSAVAECVCFNFSSPSDFNLIIFVIVGAAVNVTAAVNANATAVDFAANEECE